MTTLGASEIRTNVLCMYRRMLRIGRIIPDLEKRKEVLFEVKKQFREHSEEHNRERYIGSCYSSTDVARIK